MQSNARMSKIRRNATRKAEQLGLQEGFRSGLEIKTALIFRALGVEPEFEANKIPWVSSPENHIYTPDFAIVTASGKKIFIETKGRFMSDDRKKHLDVRRCNPEVEVRFVFSNPHSWDRPAKTKSYAKWCEENGFKFCAFKEFKTQVVDWLKE